MHIVPAGWWQRLVFPVDRPHGTVDRDAYVFCVLELFHNGLRRRDIFAVVSDRWADPGARLLSGDRWEHAKGPALNALQLDEQPDSVLNAHSDLLHGAWHSTAAAITEDGHTTVDVDGRVHVGHGEALGESASLVELRRRPQRCCPASICLR